jgi:hypothetical protein
VCSARTRRKREMIKTRVQFREVGLLRRIKLGLFDG